MALAAGIPPEMGGRLGVPSVEVRIKSGKMGTGLLKGSLAGGALEGRPGAQGKDAGIRHA
eukprot:10373976-Alexandrium_andersonii.AAC.1